tara:strand:+ start:161 stop:850 length:690 start_codon:yes stop_codon:yes gene_type:complete
MTIDQINNNPICAPIGHEEEFKRRIFLDNFRRCMTIREFQKTAGLEIKKKVEATPTARAMKEVIDSYEDYANKYFERRRAMRDFPIPRFLFKYIDFDMVSEGGRFLDNYHKDDFLRQAKLYCTKNSNYQTIIKSREDLFKEAYSYYNNAIIMNYCGNDKIYRIGYWNYWNIITFVFIKHYKKFTRYYGRDSEWVFLRGLVDCYDLETKEIKWNNLYGFPLPETKINIVL